MTTFERELRKLFGYDTLFIDARFVGNSCYGRFTDNIRVRIEFTTCGYANHYEALKITLINRNEGPIDSTVIHFCDLWGMKPTSNPNFKDGISPYIWRDSGKTSWYVYQPTKADYQELANAVKTYLEVFQEPVQGQ